MLAFLVGGILLTLWFSADTAGQGRYTDMIFGTENNATMTAEVVTPEDARAGRLASLRAKLAKFTHVAMAPSEAEVPAESDSLNTFASTTLDVPVVAVDTCSNYRAVSVPALSGLLTYAVAGGQRTFNTTQTIPAVSATSTPTVTMTSVFTLPLRDSSVGFTSCLSSDVVAVTPAGAPILNSDYAKYRSSGEATLIGYTLDGFELYGNSSSLATDACGGATVSGVYRYYLSSERPAILNCFSAIPIAL
jgi:hypothetical protein